MPCTERYWSKLLHRLGQRRRTPRLPYQRDRLLAPPQQGEGAPHPGSNSGSGVEAPAENFFNLGGGADGLTGWGGVVVAGLRRRWRRRERNFLRAGRGGRRSEDRGDSSGAVRGGFSDSVHRQSVPLFV